MKRRQFFITSLFSRMPDAASLVRGNGNYPDVRGTVRFYRTENGTAVVAQFDGLPKGDPVCKGKFFGFHIHEGAVCDDGGFSAAKGHLGEGKCPHPYHMGDMPLLPGADGTAFLAFLTDRFTVDDIIGRTVIVHSEPDDFTSQPAGNSGERMPCGEIVGIVR